MTPWLILATLAAAATLPLFVNVWRRQSKRAVRPNLQRRDFLLSPEERFFFSALQKAVGHQFTVFVHVRLGELISGRSAELDARADATVPYVLCRNQDLSTACVVELKGHSPSKQPSMDMVLIRPLLESAGLPVVAIEAGPLYDAYEIEAAVAAAIHVDDSLFATESGGRREPRISGLESLEL